MKEELEKARSKIHQTQDFKTEIIRELEDYEQRIREAEYDKVSMEKELLEKIENKNLVINE